MIYLGKTMNDLCPVNVITGYLVVRGRISGSFFQLVSGNPLLGEILVRKLIMYGNPLLREILVGKLRQSLERMGIESEDIQVTVSTLGNHGISGRGGFTH